MRRFYVEGITRPGIGTFGLEAGILPLCQPHRPQQNSIVLRFGNRNLVVAWNGGNIFSNGLSGDLEVSNSGMSPFPFREPVG